MSYPREPGPYTLPASMRQPSVESTDEAVDSRLFEFASRIQQDLADRGVASAASFQNGMLELRCAKDKMVFLRGPDACCILLRLDVPNARRLSQELIRVPLGETARSGVFEAIHLAMFGEAATTHHFAIGMRVEVVGGNYAGRRGDIGYESTLTQDDWVVYLDSPAGCKRPAKGRKRATRHFAEEDLIPAKEEATEAEADTPPARRYHAAVQGWTDGAGRKAIRSGMADHPRIGAIYLDAYARGQRAGREESERIAAHFDYTPLVIKPSGG